ncbi:unnamed protein product [Ostreobium quekettii]|uniref:Rhodanese domain-containing protein n=1 Tax=Ostreobium quekettii TaxID=121088 RepID=A0A8S1IX01_9CHLO|nr:unnamed protein product [Ostreobium quekettii]|eukprot:evm.model.scf_33.8 EVM.evm.TU.scf_33.8   scf_33:153619-157164(-)
MGCVRLPALRRGARRLRIASQAVGSEVDEMTKAEKRWESQVKQGKVRNVTCKGAGKLLAEDEDWVLLDVRPPKEVKAAKVKDSVTVPLFVPDKDMSLPSLMKQMSAFGMGGWWLGTTHMVPNERFISEVRAKIPKNSKVIVACQKGLRSLAACEQMALNGYTTLAWINGGFDTAKQGDLALEGAKDIRYAGIGGVSALLGWTEVQQQDKEEAGDRLGNIIRIAAIILVLDLLVLGYEQFSYMTGGN